LAGHSLILVIAFLGSESLSSDKGVVKDRMMFVRYHHRASGSLVDEPPYDVPERTKNKLYLALGFMILLIYVLHIVVTPLGSPPLDYLEEPTHNITIWTEPMNYSRILELEFYGSAQDAIGKTNRLAHAAPSIGINTTIDEDCVYTLPQTPRWFWVRIGYAPLINCETGEWVYGLYVLEIGEQLRIQLGGHDFTILVTRAQTQ